MFAADDYNQLAPHPVVAQEYSFKDHLGNTRLLVDPDGAGIMQASAYDPYGLRIGDLHQGPVDATGPSTSEELYHGKELTDAHDRNGYHDGARFYDVDIARWTTMDPADEFHTPYTYVGGDPVNLVDSDGRMSQSPEDVIVTGTKSEKRILRRRIDKMRTLSPRFNKTYERLDQSDTVYEVSLSDLSNVPVAAGRRAIGATWTKTYRTTVDASGSMVLKIRTSVRIDIDYQFIEAKYSNSEKQFNSTLAHEFKHAYDYDTFDGRFVEQAKGNTAASARLKVQHEQEADAWGHAAAQTAEDYSGPVKVLGPTDYR